MDFYEFARLQADLGNGAYLDEAVACLEDAIRQGPVSYTHLTLPTSDLV